MLHNFSQEVITATLLLLILEIILLSLNSKYAKMNYCNFHKIIPFIFIKNVER